MDVHLGIDIGGTKVKMGLVDGQGCIVEKNQLHTCSEDGFDAVFGNIIHETGELLKQAARKHMAVRSIGFGIPGTTDSDNGNVVFAPNLQWIDVDFVSQVKEHFDIETHIEQDTRAAAFAEYLFGAANGSKNIVCITIGTGIGCGIIIDGKIYKGAENTAGELGHTIVRPNGELCNCGRRGCLEAYASGPAVVRTAKREMLSDRLSCCSDTPTAKDVYDMAAKGVHGAKKITDEVAEILGIALVNLVNILGPEKIILSGGISNADDSLLLEPIRKFVRAHAYRMIADQVEVLKSDLGENAPLIGAAMLYRSKSIQASIEW